MELNYEEIFTDEEEPDDGNLAKKLEQAAINMSNPQTIPPYSAFYIFDPSNKWGILRWILGIAIVKKYLKFSYFS